MENKQQSWDYENPMVLETSTEFIRGTKEHTDAMNEQLLADLAIYKTRPFLNKQEKVEFSEYCANPGHNQIIANFSFSESGDYLPDAFSAPPDIVKMLYPLGEIIEDERRGTLVIDREQYHPNLNGLSYFIYMVDEELYEYYRTGQNFRGDTAPTYMFNRNQPNGVRVFKDYFALVKHLRHQRLVTYCLGPRTTFYLRYYLKHIETHTISAEYAYGEPGSDMPTKVMDALDRHLSFNVLANDFELEIKLTEDKYAQYRKLAAQFKTNLPKIQTFNNKIMVRRYSKRTMHSRTLVKLTVNGGKRDDYKALGVMPYHHILIHNDKLICYVWDTREIQAIVNVTDIESKHLTYSVNDNRSDLIVRASSAQSIREQVEAIRSEIPVQFRDAE